MCGCAAQLTRLGGFSLGEWLLGAQTFRREWLSFAHRVPERSATYTSFRAGLIAAMLP